MNGQLDGEYFTSIKDTAQGRVFSLFYAPQEEGLAVPTEVLTIYGLSSFAVGALWRSIVNSEDLRPSMPMEITRVSSDVLPHIIQGFMRKEAPGRIIAYSYTPPAALENLFEVQVVLKSEVSEQLKKLFDIKDPDDDTRPYPGQYL